MSVFGTRTGLHKKGVFDNQEVGEVEGEPAAPTISPAQASAARKAAELDAIKSVKVEAESEATSDGEVVVIEDDDITEEDEESDEPI